ncbi:hypothetical protein JCM10908_005633 [Rhodotorula pacifica]|uniref:uncharacterized protein n=1 Tax=Rhodotorula pacifica TaxID=1495444 RepID=UPI00317774DD
MTSENGYTAVPQDELRTPPLRNEHIVDADLVIEAKEQDDAPEDDDPILLAAPSESHHRQPRHSRRFRILALGFFAILFVGSSLGGLWTMDPSRRPGLGLEEWWQSLSSFRSPLPSPTGGVLCEDAYSQRGYLWRGNSATEIRWIPYSSEGATDSRNAEPVHLDNITSPPPEVLAHAPPSYNALLSSAQDLTAVEELSFMRNRTIIFVGDSHDRKNIEGFCALHAAQGAKLVVRGGHLSSRCEIPSLNFTLMSWFHYGLAETDQEWYAAALTASGDVGPFSIEDRLPAQFEPELASTSRGEPDLIILNSVYWDLRYFAMKAREEGWTEKGLLDGVRPLTWDELRWHRYRLGVTVKLFRERFPGVPLMYRTGQARATNKAGGNVAIFQINESAKYAMRVLGVPIFPWGELLFGEDDYADDMHFKVPSRATYLCADMALYYLRRIVTGDWQLGGSVGTCP